MNTSKHLPEYLHALNLAEEMLTAIMHGNNYDRLTYVRNLADIRQARDEMRLEITNNKEV